MCKLYTKKVLIDMKRIYLTLIFSAIISLVQAQKSEVLRAFSKHSIDHGILSLKINETVSSFAFDSKQVNSTNGTDKVSISKYDPSRPEGQRWELISVDGAPPSKTDLKTFNKAHENHPPDRIPDEGSYKIVKEDQDHLVVSFKYNEALLDKEGAFMKDCISYLHINLRTKLLEKYETKSEKPLKIKILNVTSLNTEVNLHHSKEYKKYLVDDQKTAMTFRILGQTIESVIQDSFSNYQKK